MEIALRLEATLEHFQRRVLHLHNVASRQNVLQEISLDACLAEAAISTAKVTAAPVCRCGYQLWE